MFNIVEYFYFILDIYVIFYVNIENGINDGIYYNLGWIYYLGEFVSFVGVFSIFVCYFVYILFLDYGCCLWCKLMVCRYY